MDNSQNNQFDAPLNLSVGDVLDMLSMLARLHLIDDAADMTFHSAREELQYMRGALTAIESIAVAFVDYDVACRVSNNAKRTTIARMELSGNYERNRVSAGVAN